MKILLAIVMLFAVNSDKIKINDPWMRPAASGGNTAAYFEIQNLTDKDDQLIKVEGKFADSFEIHETKEVNGKMKMSEVGQLTVKAKSTVSLKPKGNHVMIFDVTKDLKKGSTETLTLTFKNAGKIDVKFKITDNTGNDKQNSGHQHH